jgi:hypothetical protein
MIELSASQASRARAAAPELLEACRAIWLQLIEVGPYHKGVQEAMDKVRDALQKATGEEPWEWLNRTKEA